ncbi:hypothetical protein Tco_1220511 [Tanacetum coccineum]
MQTVAGDGVAGIKRRRRDLSSDGVRNLATALGRGLLKEDLESSTWRRRQDYKATPSPSNWLECLPARSITTWEDLTICFLAQFFPPEKELGPHGHISMAWKIPNSSIVEYASSCTDEAGGMGIGTQQPEEPEPTLEDEFQDLHLNLPVLEFLAHPPIYNAILDKYVESLELGKNGSVFVQGEVSAKMEDPGLFTLPCVDEKGFKLLDTLAD